LEHAPRHSRAAVVRDGRHARALGLTPPLGFAFIPSPGVPSNR
jgi:hypothetical protein